MVVNTSPRIWLKNMMEFIKYIVKSTSGCPEYPLFKFKMNGEAAKSNFLRPRKGLKSASAISNGIWVGIPER
jgi:hypothetical protein